jgi:hypothetical protein
MFTYAWAPDIEGLYTVIATFTGTNSYYGSSAETSFYATAPPAVSPTPQATATLSMSEQYFLPAIVGLLVAMIVGFAVVIVVLRKRP